MCRSQWHNLLISGTLAVFVLLHLGISNVKCKPEDDGDELVMSFEMPGRDSFMNDLKIVVNLTGFEVCEKENCYMICGSKTSAYCDTKNIRLCMCSSKDFYAQHLEGTVKPVDRAEPLQRNCSVSCNKRASYARIWKKIDNTQHCICLMNQMTPTGISLCDEFAVSDVCKAICQTDAATCVFNGVCICRRNWEPFFKLSIPNIRKETPADKLECLDQCAGYHHDFVGRIYDSRMNEKNSSNITYGFKEKYCLCGEWLDVMQSKETKAIVEAGFQLCTGLKCKRRCGMDEAICEPKFRRSCLCQRENIIIGNHLWARLPGQGELECYMSCLSHGLDARVLELNPFLDPPSQKFIPRYRKSNFQYLYDGKFCHCIAPSRDMHQYRPCTDELCQVICGHIEAECDQRTRRACFCNTHQLAAGIGRAADPAELNCNIECRYGLFDGRILDLKWEIVHEKWAVKVSKYCGCVRPVSAAGITHCDPYKDNCPKYCGKPDAFCTREKYCHCGITPNILNNPLVRLSNGKEQDECGEKCRSWMWPLAEDTDNKPFIYDETFGTCSESNSCPKVDTRPWKQDKPGANSLSEDAIQELSQSNSRKFCLCAKTKSEMYAPGTRVLPEMTPARISKDEPPCFKGHTCAIVGKGLNVIG